MEPPHQVAECLHGILTILNANRTLEELLDYIIAQACQLLRTPAGAIYRLNPQTGVLTLQASRGLNAEDRALDLSGSSGVVGQTVLTRQPLAIPDTAAGCQAHSDCPSTRLLTRYRALVCVPLIVKDDVYGVIALYYHEARQFCAEEMKRASVLSDQAALAIENARLVAAAQGKAVLEERQRLARDLHDSVTQALYGITLYAEAARRMLASGEIAVVASHLRELQETAQEALQEMRLLIFELRPPVLDQEGLTAALQARLEAVEERSNLHTTLNVEGQSCLPAPIEQALYRIAQETLNNILKHAHAQHVTVALRQNGPTAILEISDDGVGFEPAIVKGQGGLGLRGIAERVAQLGGQFTVQSKPGAGTRVRVEVFL